MEQDVSVNAIITSKVSYTGSSRDCSWTSMFTTAYK